MNETQTVLQKTGYHTTVDDPDEVFSFVMAKLALMDAAGAEMALLNVERRICVGHQNDDGTHDEEHSFYEVTFEAITEVEEPKIKKPWQE